MKKQYYLIEHAFLYINQSEEYLQHDNGSLGLPYKDYKSIEAFILKSGEKGNQYLTPGYHRYYGYILKANQYAGVIETKSGIVIEILPKIHQGDLAITRKAFLAMLNCSRSVPVKSFNTASLQKAKLPLLEIFIHMFCEELSLLIKKGIQSAYLPKEENERFLKGRLLVPQQIRHNHIHQERLYSAYDEYDVNRIENRIIRTTIDYLIKKAVEDNSKKRLREFQFVFGEITPVRSIKTVFQSLKLDRKMVAYEKIITWCSIFLGKESFSSSQGEHVALSLFFDMNRLFESYVYHTIKRKKPSINIKAQDRTHYLLEDPNAFQLKPDLIIGEHVIADTKWKILDSTESNNKISQSDLYQMYAYGKKYPEANTIWLIYPYKEENVALFGKEYYFEEDLKLKIVGFDCIEGEIRGLNLLEAII